MCVYNIAKSSPNGITAGDAAYRSSYICIVPIYIVRYARDAYCTLNTLTPHDSMY